MNIIFIIAGIFTLIFIGILIIGIIIDKIWDRFGLMPSSKKLLIITIYLYIIYILIKDYLFYYWVLDYKVAFSFISGIVIYLLISIIYNLISFFKFKNIEKQIDNPKSLILINKLCDKYSEYCCVYCIVNLLKLPYRNDYLIILPQIINSLKKQNKLPYNLYISIGDISDNEKKEFFEIIKILQK